jgi:hypothetical protein
MKNILFVLSFAPILASCSSLKPCGDSKGSYWKNQNGSSGGWVSQKAKVEKDTFVEKGSAICGKAKVENKVAITGESLIYSNVLIEKNSKIQNSKICHASIVRGDSIVNTNMNCSPKDDPEPKNAGHHINSTLLGIDSDNDGVRDDVEIWINHTYADTPDQDLYNYRMVLKQYAKTRLMILKNKDNAENVIRIRSEGADAMDCMKTLFYELDKFSMDEAIYKSSDLRKSLEVKFFNTRERIQADLETWKYSHGRSLRRATQGNNGCYFKIRADSYQ